MKRRDFIKAGVGAVGFPYIIPSSALGKGGTVAPSNRIVMGTIGYGWQGGSNTRELINITGVQYVAACDVDANHLRDVTGMINRTNGNDDCKGYVDYREMLANHKFDAVNIALPDHWHAIPTIDALKAGCDIHGEKPLAHNLVDGRAICNAVKRYGRIWQTGSWQRSTSNFHHACEIVRNGRIGNIHTIEVGLGGGFKDYTGSGDQVDPVPVPKELDYDRWIGPAPWAEYCPARVHKNWRWHLDYGGGRLMDWVGHHVDIAHWGIDCDHTGPIEIEGSGTRPATGLWNTHTDFDITAKYANGIVMKVSSKLSGGTKWIGDDGWVYVNRGKLRASNPGILKEKFGLKDVRLYKSNNHMVNFIECVKSRKETVTPVESAHRSASVGHLAFIAMEIGRKLKWDPENETFPNDPDANRLLSEPKRSPWGIS